MNSRLIILLFFAFQFPLVSFSQQMPYRTYKKGTVLNYRLTSESYQNNKFSGKSIAMAKTEVVQDSGKLYEEISWQSKTSYGEKDTTNRDGIAQSIRPYRISLLPDGNVPLPKLDNAIMVGEITDLNTFFVAISPKLNMHKLSRKAPVFVNEKTVEGNFAEGTSILKGSDCIQTTQKLIKRKRKYTIVETSFLPPEQSCLTPLIDTIAAKTFEFPNNFQMVQKAGPGTVNLLWGNESFVVTCKIDNRDGKILSATMTNELNLRMRVNASPELKNYAVEMPFRITRNLKLELISENNDVENQFQPPPSAR